MNILFLSTENPYPPDHGHHLRTYHVLRHLAKMNRIFFVGFSQNQNDLKYKAHLESFCASVDIFPIPGRAQKLQYILSALRNLFSAWPFSVHRYFRRMAAQRISEIAKDEKIDVVHFDMIHLAPYLEMVGNAPAVAVNHNVESLRLLRLAGVQKHLWKRLFLLLQYQKMRNFEQRMCGKFQRLITVSETDADIFKTVCQLQEISVIPNGVDADFFKPSCTSLVPNSLVWVGGMASPYNLDAVDYFLDEIFPKLYSAQTQIKVTFVGNAPTAKLQRQKIRYPDNIEIAGYVDDVRPYIKRASLFIAPMRCGSGTKIKVLNAMAMGKAIITTAIGAEGIKAIPGRDFILADTAKEFAEQTLHLLLHPEIAKIMGQNAREIIEQTYDWRVIGQTMDVIYKDLRESAPAAPDLKYGRSAPHYV
ncbi:MAG: hypothetical protein ALAOOOJD_03951 [bacterium]|nr:hypothetical protein [bacterium]